MSMKSVLQPLAASLLALAATVSTASAQYQAVTPVDPAPYRKLSCEQIAAKIRQLNVPIGNDSSTLAGLQRGPNPVLFFFTGFGASPPGYKDTLARYRGERNALIAVSVEKDCAAKMLVPHR